MKKTKSLAVIIGIVFMLFVCTSVVFADARADVIVNLQINDPMMQVNGADKEIDIGRGTKPVIINGRTLVPIRAIIEAFGGRVGWEESTQSVLLMMEDDTIKLVIDSHVAYLNSQAEILDVAPAIINDRTMLPIRFVAEGFNLGVAWNGDTQTVSIIQNSFDEDEYNALMRVLPAYAGRPYTQINNNIPFFKKYEIINASFEYYSDLDALGRCDVCFASIAEDLMPTQKRESISSVKPTGWNNVFYDDIVGGYLYNRCHLIGFQLTGENANKRNLITGTRYLNVDGMLPFENEIADYIEKTGNRVMYRSTPVFTGDNLVADGVLLEAYSVEDNGRGISFCVFCYNVQPEIIIDYVTGASFAADGTATQPTKENTSDTVIFVVYRTPKGKKYHFDAECGGKNSFGVSLDEARQAGLAPCAKCVEE